MSDVKVVYFGGKSNEPCEYPTVGVNCDAETVWLVLETKSGRKALLNMEWIAERSGGMIGDIVKEWCGEVRDA